MPEAVRPRKIFDVARELKVETPTIIEYLESRGYELLRKRMHPVDEEMYVELLRKFDPTKFQKYQADKAASKGEAKKTESIKLREEELKKILEAKKPATTSAKKKIELPKAPEWVVEEPARAARKAAREARPEKKPEAPRKAEPAAEAPVKPKVREVAPKAPIGEPKVGVVRATVKGKAAPTREAAPTPATRRKVELPRIPTLRIVEPPGRPRRLKRKRAVSVDETPVEAIETAVESKFLKEELKQDKLKAVTKKTIQPVEAPPRRRRRKKGKTSGSETAAPATRDRKRRKVDQQEVAATIKQTMAQMAGVGQHRKRYVRSATTDKGVEESAKLLVTEFLTTQDLANLFEVPVQQLIKRCLEMGMLISINQRLERDLIELLAADLNIELEFTTETEVDEEEEVSLGEYIAKRPPVVTVMGHVDHGKTTLLDTLRKTSVAESEVGGITQHIGAYEVIYNEDRITFLDTPGHEAFTAMRARGVRATDIVVLVVAADDKVMPQTVEAIDHAKAAGVPIVIAVNKIDKPGANAEAIYKQLADNNILVEKWGGKYQAAEISAKFNKGIAELLAEILVAADILELKADPTVTARGIVIESRLDRGLGAVATILVQNGTLHIGDPFVVGQHYGRVRSMFDERGEPRLEAGPSTPVQLVGFNGVPQAGDKLMVQHSEKEARDISLLRQRQYREMSIHQIKVLSLDQVNKQMRENELRKVRLIIKGDVHGSVEVLSDALMKLSTSEVKVEIIHHGVGGIIESDVLLASASRAIVIGFHVHPNPQAREVARREGVEIRLYKLIHEVVDDIKRALEGLLAPEREERYLGSLEVRQIFKISRQGNVAGCYVNDGKITRRSLVKVIRDDVALWSGQLSSLKRFKDDAREVTEGFECGLMFDGFNDVHPGDRVEAYEVIELARKLEDSV